MDKERFIKIMGSLGKLYQVNVDKEMVELWLAFFKEEDTTIFASAVNEYIRTRTTFPTVASIKKIIAENKVNELPLAEDEWNKVIEIVHEVGQRDLEEAYSKMNDYTRYIVKHVGYVNICMADSEQQKWNKKEFIEEYKSLKDQQREQIQLGAFGVDVIKMLKEHNEARELQEIQ